MFALNLSSASASGRTSQCSDRSTAFRCTCEYETVDRHICRSYVVSVDLHVCDVIWGETPDPRAQAVHRCPTLTLHAAGPVSSSVSAMDLSWSRHGLLSSNHCMVHVFISSFWSRLDYSSDVSIHTLLLVIWNRTKHMWYSSMEAVVRSSLKVSYLCI